MIDSVNTLFLPQIVLDAEVVGMIRAFSVRSTPDATR